MRYLSLFSGIEAVSVAAKGLNWTPVAFSEIAEFPCAVLKYHFPDVPNLGDVRNINGVNYNGTVDLVVGGSPCQDFSIAGNRAGLHGERSGLAREYIRLLGEIRPKWFLWKNVPGALSTNGGNDFSKLICEIQELGYGVAWRVLDAQYFGVPQRRRRVFIVGYFGDWRPPVAVLFESKSLSGNFAKSGKKECQTSGRSENCFNKTIYINNTYSNWTASDICATLRQRGNLGSGGSENIIIEASAYPAMLDKVCPSILASAGKKQFLGNQEAFSGKYFVFNFIHDGAVNCPTLSSRMGTDGNNVLITLSSKSFSEIKQDNIGTTLRSSGGNCGGGSENYVIQNLFVRKLTPLECERLQGLPDNYTDVPYKGKPHSPLSKRYEAIGNSIAVPVLRWIFERMDAVETLKKSRA